MLFFIKVATTNVCDSLGCFAAVKLFPYGKFSRLGLLCGWTLSLFAGHADGHAVYKVLFEDTLWS
jgi:hypothetical protein